MGIGKDGSGRGWKKGNVPNFVVGWRLEWIWTLLLKVEPTLLADDSDAFAGSGSDVAGDWKGIRTELLEVDPTLLEIGRGSGRDC